MKQVDNLLIVGGGSAGLIAALILKTRLNIKIDVVHSKNIGIVGVGEGSTEHFRTFMEMVGIDHYDIIKHCDATYKAGIMFEGWNNKSYLHNVGSPFNERYAQYNYVYAKQIGQKSNYMNSKLIWENKIEKFWFDKKQTPFNQFHFNTFKLNDFLISYAKKLGINVYEDDIDDVVVGENGFITELKSATKTYAYDFYIDSTGFKRLLMTKLGAKWNSYKKYLRMNSAITFQTGDTDNYNVWTLAKALSSGWLFRIPVWGRHGNGYIFDSNYIDETQAKAEVEKLYGQELNIGKKFQFDPGALDKAWINNCVAIGLSGSFVEPLEATSIGTTIQQSLILMHRLANYDQAVIDSYNKSVDAVMENIRDFVILHYITKRQDTEFWKDLKNFELPESLSSRLERWRTKLPISEDFNLSDYILFGASNFTVVMEGLELFDRNAIETEFQKLNSHVKVEASRIIIDQQEHDRRAEYLLHKEFLSMIRQS
jgi:tryptophan halogenase